MKPLRTRLQEARKRLGLPWEVLERDYLLSWVLASIGQVEALRETLVFKGGTALTHDTRTMKGFARGQPVVGGGPILNGTIRISAWPRSSPRPPMPRPGPEISPTG